MTPYESERERLAMITDLQLRIRAAKEEGKTSFTAEELMEALLDIAEDIKQHK